MKIGWATPLHHESAVGRASVGITRVLAQRGFHVDLLRTERADLLRQPCLTSELKIVKLAGMDDDRALRDYDLLVYNIGDDAGLHYHAVDAAMRYPGLCIFHDVRIFNLFSNWMAARGETNRIATVIDEIYGQGSREPAESVKCSPGNGEMPPSMLEWLAPYALGAVAHCGQDLARLTQSCAGPVSHIPPAIELPDAIGPLCLRNDGDPLRLVTFGPMDESALCSEVIRSLGRSRRLARNCIYRLAGSVSKPKQSHLAGLAKRLGVSFEVTGALSRPERAKQIENADAILCLRQPVPGGACDTAVESMLSGRPTIVIDHGFYQELPGDLTLKLPPEFTMPELAEKMLWLLDHPAESRQLGERAAEWARDAFSFDRYADAFLQLAPKAIESEPLMHLGTQLGQELAALGVHADDPAAVRIAQTAMSLFCQGGELCPQI